MTDAPLLPMPELETPPLRTYEVTWRMEGKLTVFGTSEAVARAEANELNARRLVLFSDEITVTKSEPKEVAGE
jgi:hypothetical protein